MRPYAGAGIIVAVALTGAALWELRNPSASPTGLNSLPIRLANPACAIGLALLVLAWAERNRALFLLILAYPAIVLVPVSFGSTGHPASGLDDIVHQRVRLGILTIAHEARRVEFSFLRTNLELSAGNLSQHLGVPDSVIS